MNRRGWNQLFGGLLLIGIGVYFILHEMGIVQPSLGRMIATFWPVILIWVGLQGMFNQRDNVGGFIGSLIPLIIGLFFLGRNLDLVYFSFGDMIKLGLPAVLIGYGLYVIFKPRNHQPPRPPKTYDRPPVERDVPFPEVPEAPKLESSLDEMFEQTFGTKNGKEQPREPEPEFMHERPRRREYKQDWNWGHGDTVNKSAFIGDIHMGQDYFTLKPTNVSQFIGDTVLDLTKAQIPYGETKINISAFIGDVKVFVPNDSDIGVCVTTNSFIGDMSVIGQTRSGFMSSADLESPDYREAGKKLRINVSVFIGDVKVNKVG
ncbi:cell wall-active antibiotics response protein LiaF [Paenibacillus sp. DMB20]|uniref:cell wall-active antibiotics response protein LiaF n=1 Tax=Paenibacillus sp. DMB20 TaxID=1642570 RepID=UPI00062752C3|nr:cell wall-active antibiotics response protein LiaF [Paenibacillus sp. DMB20]KKO53617.1 cell wall-active antibiotics response protein [Paenibacillus sp. DMB20]